MNKMVNLHIALGLMFVFAVVGCKAPPKMTDDTMVSSTVEGVTFTHRFAVQPPAQFSPVNEAYRALYPASVMTRPDFSGKVVSTLQSGETYTVIGQVENNWLALGEIPQGDEPQAEDNKATEQTTKPNQLIGYVPFRAVVKSELYDQTIKADQPKRRARVASKKKNCVSVDGDSKACQNTNSGTWIIN